MSDQLMMKYPKQCAVALLISITSGCMSHQEVASAPAELQFQLIDNYQAVYARTLASMRHCIKPGASYFPASAQNTLEGQLYSELGYGEIIQGLSGLMPGTLSTIRVEKDGSGAMVKVKTANQVASAKSSSLDWIEYWIRGGSACPSLGAMEAPKI